MSNWYEVFDNEEVQLQTRTQAAKLSGVWVGALAVTLAVVIVARVGVVHPVLGVAVVAAFWYAVGWWSIRRLHRLRRVVWCVKLSDRRVVGYDYTRRKVTLDWTKVSSLEVDARGLTLHGEDGTHLHITTLFPDFARLSHRAIEYAEFYGIEVTVDGHAWQDLDVYALFPFLGSGSKAPEA